MTQEEYHARRRRIEAERRRAIGLIEAAHLAQLRALDLVWLGGGGVPAAPLPVPEVEGDRDPSTVPEPVTTPEAPPAAADPAPPAWPAAPPRRTTKELVSDILTALERLPEVFTTSDLLRLLGYVPHRGTLHRLLMDLESEDVLRKEQRGEGRKATRYRQVSAASLAPEPPGGQQAGPDGDR